MKVVSEYGSHVGHSVEDTGSKCNERVISPQEMRVVTCLVVS